jgi:hypothetical protein
MRSGAIRPLSSYERLDGGATCPIRAVGVIDVGLLDPDQRLTLVKPTRITLQAGKITGDVSEGLSASDRRTTSIIVRFCAVVALKAQPDVAQTRRRADAQTRRRSGASTSVLPGDRARTCK